MASSTQPSNANSSGNMNSVPFNLIAAGHQGITTDASGSLLIKPCTQAEIDFYESAKNHTDFQVHMPLYFGSLKLNTDPAAIAAATGVEPSPNQTKDSTGDPPNDEPWRPSGGAKLDSGLSVVLSNATAGFKRPSVLDLKLGARLWDDDAPPAKRQRLEDVANSTTSGTLGFRVAGMKVYIGNEGSENVSREIHTTVHDGYKSYDKFYGRTNIQTENIRSAFEAFLSSVDLPVAEVRTDRKMLKRKLLARICEEIESLQNTLEAQEMRMYSASVLIVYEGDPAALDEAILHHEAEEQKEAAPRDENRMDSKNAGTDEDNNEEDEEEDGQESDDEEKFKMQEVVMIDFAHAHWTPGQGLDENLLKGVRNISKILHEMLDELK